MKRLKRLELSTFCMASSQSASHSSKYGRFRVPKMPIYTVDSASLMPNLMPNGNLMPNPKKLMPNV